MAGLAVGSVLWALPLLQQALRRPGNLTLVARSAGGETQGVGFAAKVVAWGVGVPPAAVRSATGGWEALGRIDPGRITRLGALLVVGALVALAVVGVRRRDREVAVPPLLVLGLLASALVVFRATPTDRRGVSILYTSWWLIPTGMLAWVVLGATTLRVAPSLAAAARGWAAARPARTPVVVAVVVALTVAVAVGTPIHDPEDHLYAVARTAGDAVVAEVRSGGRYEVEAFGTLGFQLASGLAFRIRRAGGHPVIRGGDGVSAGPEYVPRGIPCDAVIGLVVLEPGAAEPRPVDGGEVLLVADVPSGPAVEDRRFALTWSPDTGPPSC